MTFLELICQSNEDREFLSHWYEDFSTAVNVDDLQISNC